MAKVGVGRQAAEAWPPAPSYADLLEFGRETLEALCANAALSAWLGAIGQGVAQSARTTFVSAGETARGLLGARTLEDVVRLQTDFAKRSFDGFLEQSAKLSELGCSLFGASLGARGARAKS